MSDCYYDISGCLICPEQEPQSYVPSHVDHRPVLGWNAGANTIIIVDGDLHLVFDMPLGEIGAIVGLKSDRNQTTVPSLIEHGWYFHNVGGIDLAQPIERGVLVGDVITGRSNTTLFEIRRVNSLVVYFKDSEQVYTSSVQSNGAKLTNCCLYASGDSVPSGGSA